MPNWCDNELSVRGPKEDVEAFVEKAVGKDGDDDSSAISIEALFPVPKALLDVEAGSKEAFYEILYGDSIPSHIIDKMREEGFESPDKHTALEWQAEKWEMDGMKAREVAHAYLVNMETYGHMNWYTWCINNWGTKWDTRSGEQVSFDEVEVRGKQLWQADYTFLSAWSPPTNAFLRISMDYPSLEFTLKYWECGAGFKGIFKCKNGRVYKDTYSAYSGDRGG